MMNNYKYYVGQVFSEVACTYPDNKAIIWSRDNVITYSELDKISNQVANFLISQNIKKGERVCIILDKYTITYSIIIACLKIGAPYFVIDPANPSSRKNYILEKCFPSIVFIDKDIEIDYAGSILQINNKEQFDPISNQPTSSVNLEWEVTGADPAYIMFTSGSTGFPKGVVISHANLLNFIQWTQWQYDISPNDIFTNVNPLFFDNSVFDIYSSLMSGAALVPFNAETIRNPHLTLQRIDELECTVYFSVPSFLIFFQTLKLINPNVFKSLKKIIFGGEGYPKAKLKELYDCFKDRIQIVNVYGPTECTCICSSYNISDNDFKDMEGLAPLGSLIPNFSYIIIDENKMPVENDKIGELCLGGPCVGLGYFNDAELTENSFIQNPLNNKFHHRIYKTGDLVRYNNIDKKIYFVGRKDSQIKHQGYRIELGEIEHALSRVQNINEAVALHTVKHGISTIIGVVASEEKIDESFIKNEIAKLIPKYMIPNKIKILEQLPKNANGKIDRNLLKNTYC